MSFIQKYITSIAWGAGKQMPIFLLFDCIQETSQNFTESWTGDENEIKKFMNIIWNTIYLLYRNLKEHERELKKEQKNRQRSKQNDVNGIEFMRS